MAQLPKFLSLIGLAIGPIAILFLAFGLLERWFPAGTLKRSQGWLFNIKLSLMYLAVPTAIGGLITTMVAAIRRINGRGLIDLNFDPGMSIAGAAIAALLYLLVWDFFYYWWHRAQHSVSALWAIHKLHHMDETLGVSTQMRVHWLEEIGRVPFIFAPMALLFDLPLHTGITAFVLTGWSAFIHANLRVGFGRASVLVAGPQVHRIHHSNQPQHFDKNYAAFFPFYDAIFRTYYPPARGEYPSTGIKGEPEISSIRDAFLMPFPVWARLLKNWRDKIA
jgi:sterol desaturase/sphingolipid hydroxylase (fatty acid hydroxylase superfamily)